jgi:4-hydroxythreonine-4-phosphate dehydrogenase
MVVDFQQDTAGFWVNARATAEGGRASLRFFDEAIAAAKLGHLDAIVTGPINKTSWKLAGCRFTGHTDKLAEELGARRHTMAFIAELNGAPGAVGGLPPSASLGGPSLANAKRGASTNASATGATGGSPDSALPARGNNGSPASVLRVALASTHTGLFQLRNQFTIGLVYQPIDLLHEALINWFGIEQPRIAVLGLNPHAGEDGLLGDEEKRVIEPAMQMARNQGVNVEGPFPADSFFVPATRSRYDGVVAMYHDQGLIPVKMLAFDRAVNVTLGLGVIRTSPDHGTAFDIAGTSQAHPGSMKEALRLACTLAANARTPAVSAASGNERANVVGA